ncbi:hypothetical protein CTZ27_20815 [Streptomyces griseocarneus]|nr:hypothetical protein CTZ27_20815 [Streptomyces griseocarneus]
MTLTYAGWSDFSAAAPPQKLAPESPPVTAIGPGRLFKDVPSGAAFVYRKWNDVKNIKKKALGRLAVAAVVAPLAVVGISGEASARNGDVEKWRNAATGLYLNHDGQHDVYTSKNSGRSWTDRAISEDSSGQGVYQLAWTVNGRDLLCLDSSDAGKVYMNPCNKGNWQKWRVYKVDGGWKIVNFKTGRALDSSDGGKVYTKPQNTGKFQIWK